MLIKTEKTDIIMNFLKQELLLNQNIIGIIENVPEAVIYVDNSDSPKGVLVEKGYFRYIYSRDDGFIDYVLDNYFKEGYYGFSGTDKAIAARIKARYELDWENPCTLYYMPAENLNRGLIKSKVSSVDIKDAQTIDYFYQFRNRWSLEAIKKDIKLRPSSAVYIDDDIACWVLVHDDNSMGIMYTKDEYRRKGYAVDVTIDLASKIIEQGKIPYLQIVEGNSMSPGLAHKCGFLRCGEVTWFGIKVGNPKETDEDEEDE
ncbi:MAG: GNAT family N-acetyltransferase [Bacillota bacterium]